MYDNCEGGNKSFTNSSSYCSSKGMRIPIKEETKAWNTNGVPSCSKWTWTISPFPDGGNYVWNNLTLDGAYYSSIAVRCVK